MFLNIPIDTERRLTERLYDTETKLIDALKHILALETQMLYLKMDMPYEPEEFRVVLVDKVFKYPGRADETVRIPVKVL